jgi:hypothetical protein
MKKLYAELLEIFNKFLVFKKNHYFCTANVNINLKNNIGTYLRLNQ